MLKMLAFLLLIPAFTLAQKNYPALLDNYMQAQAKVNGFSGNVLIAQKGKVIYNKAFGLANREWNIPNAVDTRFRIGSITKQFTAVGILQLVDEGKLSLDDKLIKFFPGFPKGDSVTIHMLLNHTSGIWSYTNTLLTELKAAIPYPKDSIIAQFKDQPYDFTPGSRYSYNNSGYFLLGQIIEKISGHPYEKYISDMVKKAGLKNTAVLRSDTILPNSASSYVLREGKWKASQYWALEAAFSAGAMSSTIDDLLAWQNALFGGKMIFPASLEKMTTPYLGNYGYGAHILMILGDKHIGHGGGFSSFNNYSVYLPDHNISVIVLSNNNAASANIGWALAGILLNKPVFNAYKHEPMKMDPLLFDKYAGRYELWDGTTTELVRKGDKFFRRLRQSDAELQPESSNQFFYKDGRDIQIRFTVNSKGGIDSAELINHGLVTSLKKLD